MARFFYPRVGRHRNLCAILDERAAYWQLTAILPVRYSFRTLGRPDDTEWTPAEMQEWQRDFEERAERTWSRRWLIEAGRRSEPGVPERWGAYPHLPIVEVVLDIQEDPRWDVYTTVQVIHTNAGGDRAETAVFDVRRSADTLQLMQEDVRSRWSEDGRYFRRGSDHEVGHLLGLSHPVCPENEDVCYGIPGSPSAEGIMGRGMTVRIQEYQVFQEIMSSIRPQNVWRVSPDRSCRQREVYDGRTERSVVRCVPSLRVSE